MANKIPHNQGRLSEEEMEKIDSTNLPLMDRHYLRLLAHCLNCFKSIALEKGMTLGSLPNSRERYEWCLKQAAFASEKTFIPIFLEQLEVAAAKLNLIATDYAISPLELDLSDLMTSRHLFKNVLND